MAKVLGTSKQKLNVQVNACTLQLSWCANAIILLIYSENMQGLLITLCTLGIKALTAMFFHVKCHRMRNMCQLIMLLALKDTILPVKLPCSFYLIYVKLLIIRKMTHLILLSLLNKTKEAYWMVPSRNLSCCQTWLHQSEEEGWNSSFCVIQTETGKMLLI